MDVKSKEMSELELESMYVQLATRKKNSISRMAFKANKSYPNLT